ncbi:nitronate monooxygenase family protein [Apibacter sp. HY039]|uniref:NAD(P)H-dependent flavin oxidoreductase n=1 Tax=Apibacter sp. HY039 TaxID=2501476 RepID=UPI000FEBFDD8|nr:nitronate monooxygenase [Apibacter sp. HY039]
MRWENKITQLLGIDYPIIQAPMFGVATPEMVVASAKANILGVLPLGDLSAEKCVEIIRKTKKMTNKPFAVNIFVNNIPPITDELKIKYKNAKQFIQKLAYQHSIDFVLPELEDLQFTDYQDQIDAIIGENCKILSFTFGKLDKQSIEKLKVNETFLIGTCTSVEEAKILENLGIDIICVQGIEAGGHRGSFVNEDILDDIPKIGGLSLLSQVYDHVNVPLIYAGGIYNANTLLASKILGAQGFQIGSLLLGSVESSLNEAEKARLRSVKEKDVILTKSFSGKYARGIRNIFIDTIQNTEFILPYPYQYKLTSELKKIAKSYKNTDFVSIWTGQSLNSFSGNSTTQIIEELIQQTENIKKSIINNE